MGGNVHYYKPTLEFVHHMRVIGNTSLGMRVMGSYLHGYGGVDPPEGEEIDIFDVEQTGVPYYNRFFLGGEYQIRGYYIRSVGPRNARGQLLGGDKMLLFNAEYAIPLAGPLRAILFFDAGNAFAEEDRLEPLHAPGFPDLDGHRDAGVHPHAERAVPPHLRLQSPSGLLPSAHGLRLRDRNDLLAAAGKRRVSPDRKKCPSRVSGS